MSVVAHGHDVAGAGIAWIELPTLAIGVPTMDVLGIRESAVLDDSVLDLDARFGAPKRLDAQAMARVIELRTGHKLATRAVVLVEMLAAEDKFDLPAFVSDWAHVRGLSRLVRRDAGFGFLVDPGPWFEVLARVSDEGEREVKTL